MRIVQIFGIIIGWMKSFYYKAEELINNQTKVSEFITTAKRWNLQNLKSILPDNIY